MKTTKIFFIFFALFLNLTINLSSKLEATSTKLLNTEKISKQITIESEVIIPDPYTLWRNNDYKTAYTIYESELKTTTDAKKSVEIKKNLATIAEQAGDYKKAIELYGNILNISQDENSYSQIGKLYYNIDDLDNAETNLKKAINLNPSDIEANFNLGRVFLEQKNFNDAITYLQKTIELNENFAIAYFYLAQSFQGIGNIMKSIENYKTCLKKDFYFAEAQIPLLQIYLENKEYEKTYKQICKIKNIAPENDESDEALEEIKDKVETKPESITSQATKGNFKTFLPAPNRENIPMIRVAINTNLKGKPNKRNLMVFKSSGDFYFKENGKIIFEGTKSKKYSIALKNNMLNILNANGSVLKTAKKIRIQQKEDSINSFMLYKIDFGKGTHFATKTDNQYRGDFEISIYGNSLFVVNIVNIEEYCYGVISSEIMSWWPIEAIKAQAILIRNHAFYKKEKYSIHKKLGYDVCYGQHCQVYKGISTEVQNMNNAVDETRGEVLVSTENGNLVHGFFCSNSGGATQSSKNVNGWSSVDYLEDTFEGYDTAKEPNSPNEIERWLKSSPKNFGNDPSLKTSAATFRWSRVIKPEYIEDKIKQIHKQNIGKIQNIIVLKRSKSGHVNKVLVKGNLGNIVIEKENLIRSSLGLGALRSTMFWIEKKMNKTGKILEFTIYGGGWGHGIGMSQTGAAGMANKGYSCKDILKFYYKNTEIMKRDY